MAHYVVEMIMKCLNVLCANPSSFLLLRCIMRVKVLFEKECFSCFKIIVAMTITNQWPILAIRTSFWE